MRNEPFPMVAGVCDLPGNVLVVVLDDGSVYAAIANGDDPRTWVEGTPVPRTERETRLRDAAVRETIVSNEGK